MKRAGLAAVLALAAVAARAQTHIASDVEIRQMEEAARKASSFPARVSAHINLGELRMDRNESAAAQQEFETALRIARDEKNDARRERDLQRYALACGWSGVALADLGRGAEAFADLEEAVRYQADSPSVWNHYSVAMFRLGKNEKAIGAARNSVAAAERKTAAHATVRDELDLDIDRLALAGALLELDDRSASEEAESILRDIAASLDGEAFQSVRAAVAKHEEFQLLTAPTTETGLYLALFHRSHLRLARLYENAGAAQKAIAEYQAVLGRRSDEPSALAGMARLSSDPKERDRYFILSLDANPFAPDVIDDYDQLVAAGNASPAAPTGSVGSRVRLAVQQLHGRDYRGARETLQALLAAHPNNDVLQSLLARVERESAPAGKPWFLTKPAKIAIGPTEAELRAVLSLFATNAMSAEERALLDREEFSNIAAFDAGLQQGTIHRVPMRFQSPVRASSQTVRVIYRILGATTVDGRDALLLELVRTEGE